MRSSGGGTLPRDSPGVPKESSMDIPAFLLEREALQQRMETHRLAADALMAERQGGVMPKLLRTGASLFFGFGARGQSAGWMSSLLWSLVAPALLGVVRQS